MPETPLNLTVLGLGLSLPGTLDGASRICLECVRRWTASGAVRATIVTSAPRRDTCVAYGLTENVRYVLWPDAPGVWSMAGHLRAAARSLTLASHLPRPSAAGPNVLYTASEFLPDVVAGARYKRRFRDVTWVASRFLFVPSAFKGWKHAYDPGIHVPDPMLFLAGLYHRIPFELMVRGADAYFITNELDGVHFARRGVARERVLAVYGGVHAKDIAETPSQPLRYDGVFVGRISPQKGVLDLVDVWARVVRSRPEARLALIGVGHRPFEEQMKDKMRTLGIEKNVDLLGFLDGRAKHEVYRASRVFLHTSVYDNYGMAACEAMAAGVPAVVYDLPPLQIAYPQGVLRARRHDPQHFADLVLSLLADEAARRRLATAAAAWAATQDWDRKAEETLAFVRTAVARRGERRLASRGGGGL